MRRMKLRVVLSGLALSTLLGGSASAATHQLVATLDGAQEVPAVNTAATGSATLTYDDVTNKLTGTLTYQGVTATAIHIHEEKRGVNGGVALDIGALPSPIAIDLTVDEANEPALLAEGTYINIHSGNFVNGEIRGQITAPPADAGSDAATGDGGGSSSGASSSGASSGASGSSSGASSSGTSGATTTRVDSGTAAPPVNDDGGCKTSPASGGDGSAPLLALGTAVALGMLVRGRRGRRGR